MVAALSALIHAQPATKLLTVSLVLLDTITMDLEAALSVHLAAHPATPPLTV